VSTTQGVPALGGSGRSLLLGCVAFAAGWPVYGISGALASQVITGVVLWKVLSHEEVGAVAAA
jgi:hypothetical protein